MKKTLIKYREDDILWKRESFEEERKGKNGHISYITCPVINFYTKDGKYYSKPDSSGFSYWHDLSGFVLGNYSYDYIFGTLIENNIQDVLRVLNKVI